MSVNVRTVRVSEKGEIAIPTKIRRNLGLRKGSQIVLIEHRGRLLIMKAERVLEALSNDLRHLTRHAEETFLQLWDGLTDDVWDDV